MFLLPVWGSLSEVLVTTPEEEFEEWMKDMPEAEEKEKQLILQQQEAEQIESYALSSACGSHAIPEVLPMPQLPMLLQSSSCSQSALLHTPLCVMCNCHGFCDSQALHVRTHPHNWWGYNLISFYPSSYRRITSGTSRKRTCSCLCLTAWTFSKTMPCMCLS